MRCLLPNKIKLIASIEFELTEKFQFDYVRLPNQSNNNPTDLVWKSSIDFWFGFVLFSYTTRFNYSKVVSGIARKVQTVVLWYAFIVELRFVSSRLICFCYFARLGKARSPWNENIVSSRKRKNVLARKSYFVMKGLDNPPVFVRLNTSFLL